MTAAMEEDQDEKQREFYGHVRESIVSLHGRGRVYQGISSWHTADLPTAGCLCLPGGLLAHLTATETQVQGGLLLR